MSDGFKMQIRNPRDQDAWKRKKNGKDLREVTAKYLAISPQEKIFLSIGSKHGAIANIMRLEGTSCETISVVCLVTRKGGRIAVPQQVISAATRRMIPIRCYLEGISNNFDWRFYQFSPLRITEDEKTVLSGSSVWFNLRLGTAWGVH